MEVEWTNAYTSIGLNVKLCFFKKKKKKKKVLQEKALLLEEDGEI